MGQSSEQDEVDAHFICFVEKEGDIYELDGRKDFPVNHGPTTKGTFLADACKIVQKFMERDPDEIKFTIMVLARKPE